MMGLTKKRQDVYGRLCLGLLRGRRITIQFGNRWRYKDVRERGHSWLIFGRKTAQVYIPKCPLHMGNICLHLAFKMFRCIAQLKHFVELAQRFDKFCWWSTWVSGKMLLKFLTHLEFEQWIEREFG